MGQGPEAHPDDAALLLEMAHSVVDALEREVWKDHYKHAPSIHAVIPCMLIAVMIVFIAHIVLLSKVISRDLAW